MNKPKKDLEPLLCAKELGELLGFTADAIRNQEGITIPAAIRIGKFLRWRDSDVAKWLDEQAQQAARPVRAKGKA